MLKQRRLPFKLERTNEKITPHAGLALGHEFHLALGLDRLLDEHMPVPGSNRRHEPSEVVLPVVLMQQACVLPEDLSASTVGTIRWRFYQMGARLVRHGRSLVLKVAADAQSFAQYEQFRRSCLALGVP